LNREAYHIKRRRPSSGSTRAIIPALKARMYVRFAAWAIV
jgi:hypothetical protein